MITRYKKKLHHDLESATFQDESYPSNTDFDDPRFKIQLKPKDRCNHLLFVPRMLLAEIVKPDDILSEMFSQSNFVSVIESVSHEE